MENENENEKEPPKIEVSLFIIASELAKIRQIMEMDLKQKNQLSGKYSVMMSNFFKQGEQ